MGDTVINGGIVHYETFGYGRPIIFIHGWLGSWRYWLRTMEALSSNYRVYALDLWGFGDSDKSQERYSVSDYTDLLSDFMESVGIVQAALVGHALGAVVALRLAALYPDRVSRLAAVSLPVTPSAISGRLLDFAGHSPLAKLRRRGLVSHKEVLQEVEKIADNAIALSVQSSAEVDVQAFLLHVAQPTLIIYGEKDDLVDPVPTRGLGSQRHTVRPIGLPNSKHFPMLDEPNQFNRLLEDFLGLYGDDLSGLEVIDERHYL